MESTSEARLQCFLLAWEERRESGQEPTPEELCRTCPELLDEVRRRIAALRGFGDLVPSTVDGRSDAPPGAGSTARSRASASARADFRDLRFHAEGGLDEVFRARHEESGREVALKFLKPHRADAPESQRRFLLEAEVTGRLEHPGIVPVYGLGLDESDAPCYAMRFIRGEALRHAVPPGDSAGPRASSIGAGARGIVELYEQTGRQAEAAAWRLQ